MKKISAGILLLAYLLAMISFAQPQTGGFGLGGNPRPNKASLAFFEAFPANGRGTFGPCSTTPPTGAKGEVLTFTRATNATCTRTVTGARSTTGIANGDLVVLSSNQPRVSYGSDGVLGLLVEGSRTNSCLRSQQLDNAAWASLTSAGAVTVTPDFAVSPEGTTTAQRVQYAACPTAATASVRGQSGITGLGTSNTSTFYVRGNGTSGNVGVVAGIPGAYFGLTCAYVSGSWTRCVLPVAASSTEIYIGCWNLGSTTNSPGNTGSGDILVWGAQTEPGAYATSYIPTVAAAVTRNSEIPQFGPLTFGITTNRASVAASVERTTGAAQATPWLIQNVYQAVYTGTFTNFHYPAGSFFGTLAMPGSGVVRLATGADGVTRTNCVNGTCESTGVVSTNFTGSPWTFIVGSEAGAKFIDSVISRICVDPDPTRCR